MGETPVQKIGSAGSLFLTGLTEILQRVLIVVADLLLILFATISLSKDWGHSCDENLHSYTLMCVVLCLLDLAWEIVRCSLESSLDRLQQEFGTDGPSNILSNNGNEGLLGESPVSDGVVGSPSVMDGKTDASPARISSGPLGHGVRREKAKRQKRTNDFHLWSIVFSSMVGVVFSLFSSHDEECAEKVPTLYQYIHVFTYVYIFKLGALILSVCCRMVKDYEDAAQDWGGIAPKGPGTQQLATFTS
mmetsp:Transcript_128737/g.321211  ORF Transcript_128737/g.321211 Transcript_128737/m.321211 type:complete len:247 (-) Transcript_128737:230-970(-)